jgi:hypothetical protein
MAPGWGSPSESAAEQVKEIRLGLGGIGCRGIRLGLTVPCCTVLLNCEEFCDNGDACCEVQDGSATDKISESWRSAWSCAVPI